VEHEQALLEDLDRADARGVERESCAVPVAFVAASPAPLYGSTSFERSDLVVEACVAVAGSPTASMSIVQPCSGAAAAVHSRLRVRQEATLLEPRTRIADMSASH
jgi:hypothetical protein